MRLHLRAQLRGAAAGKPEVLQRAPQIPAHLPGGGEDSLPRGLGVEARDLGAAVALGGGVEREVETDGGQPR